LKNSYDPKYNPAAGIDPTKFMPKPLYRPTNPS